MHEERYLSVAVVRRTSYLNKVEIFSSGRTFDPGDSSLLGPVHPAGCKKL